MPTFSDKPWGSISASDYASTEAYCAACMVDMNEGTPKVQAKCKLPYKEPGGAVNKGALRAIAAVLGGSRGGVDAPAAAKKAAARKTLTLMRQAKMEPGEGLQRMAAGM